ncbi:MAG: DUF917 family protein [Alphaproteobacteria bacterium]
MRRRLNQDDIEPMMLGGLVLSAGGSGLSRMDSNRAQGRMALGLGAIDLCTLDEYDADDVVLVATGVGAPGGATKRRSEPRDAIRAAEMVIEAYGKMPVGVFAAHAGGFGAWLIAAALNIDVVDVAGNGRGHPTVEMGALGQAGDTTASVIQAAYCSGRMDGDAPISVLYDGNIANGEFILRAAATRNGGGIPAARGPHTVAFLKKHAAVGAVDYQYKIGQAMAAKKEGPERYKATTKPTKGKILVEGKVVSNTCKYGGGFDVGFVTIEGKQGTARLAVWNEYMAAELNGKRVGTFPDLQASMDLKTGNPIAISEMKKGVEVAILTASKHDITLGDGVWDKAVYPQAEEMLGISIAKEALAGRTGGKSRRR